MNGRNPELLHGVLLGYAEWNTSSRASRAASDAARAARAASDASYAAMATSDAASYASDAARDLNITNEGGVERRYRVLKNIMGLGIIERIRR